MSRPRNSLAVLALSLSPWSLAVAQDAGTGTKPPPRPLVVESVAKPGPTAEALSTAMVGPTQGVRGPADRPKASSSLVTTRTERTERLVFDEPRAGELHVATTDFKSSFMAGAWSYIPFFGSDAQRNFGIEFRLTGVTVDGAALELAPPTPRRSDARVSLDRGPVREFVDFTTSSAEHGFVFERLARRGEISLDLAVSTELTPRPHDGGVRFEHATLGHVDYSKAFAIDAKGRRLELTMSLAEGRISLSVPRSFVESAEFPLIVDPGVTTYAQNRSQRAAPPDSAFDHTYASHLMVWSEVFSATDTDIYAQRLDIDLAPVGAPFALDITTALWDAPAIANKFLGSVFLMVAEVFDATAQHWHVAGRIVPADASATLGNPFDIERGGVVGRPELKSSYSPDVGGDPHPSGPTWFTVVFVYQYSGADQDILMKQIDETGALRSQLPTIIDQSTENDYDPSISNSNGSPQFGAQRWYIAFNSFSSNSQVGVKYAALAWDGQRVPVGGQSSRHIPIPTSGGHYLPRVSSPLDGDGTLNPRKVMIVYTHDISGVDANVTASIVDENTTVIPSWNIHHLEGGGFYEPWDQSSFGVTADGCRFVVAYTEEWNGNPFDRDVRVSTFRLEQNGALSCDEPRAAVANSFDDEIGGSVAAMYEARGAAGSSLYPLNRFVVTSKRVRSLNPISEDVAATYYDAMRVTGGYSTRPIACGDPNLVMVVYSGDPALGNELTINLSDVGPLTGILFGVPTNLPVPGCVGCTLGVDGIPLPQPYTLRIPCVGALIGATFSVQGMSFANGTCFGGISLTDAVDLTIR